MIQREVRLTYKQWGDEIRIKPLSDVHYGHTTCDLAEFKQWLDEDPDCYFLGNGDLMDCIIVSDLKRYRKDGDASYGQAIVDEQVNGLAQMLLPYAGRFIGIGTGNHEDEITKRCGTNPSARLAEKLAVPYLGYTWMLVLRMSREGESGGGTRSVTVMGHHGWGGGSRTAGGSMTKYAKHAMGYKADVCLYGHDHDLEAKCLSPFRLNGTKLVSIPKWVVLTGTFQRTLGTTTEPSYAERMGYPGRRLGGSRIRIIPQHAGGAKIRVET